MPRPTDFARHIEKLVAERERYAAAVARIGATLGRIRSVLGATGDNGNRLETSIHGRPSARTASTAVKPARRRRRRGRGAYATTADESLLTFVREHRNPTTHEIKAHWKSEGRGGTADNALSKLVREKKLKRTPLEDRRGSRFSLA